MARISLLLVLVVALTFSGCEGETGQQGDPGQQGPQGEQGPPGSGLPGQNSLVKITDEEPGVNCPTGGKLIEVGPDTDNDGELDPEEVTDSKYICNGEKGPQGDVGPQGEQGTSGSDGLDGTAGLECWDLDGDRLCTLPLEDANTDGTCDVLDCRGSEGPQGLQGEPGSPGQDGLPGTDGIHCWDLDGDGICTPATEDKNTDGSCDAADCQGQPGTDGSPDTPAEVLAKLIQVDGSGSGLDADTLDGIDSSALLARISQLESDLLAAQNAIAQLGGTAPYAWDGADNLLGPVYQIFSNYLTFYDAVYEVVVKVFTIPDSSYYFYFDSADCSGVRWFEAGSSWVPGIYSFGFLDRSNGDICAIPDGAPTTFASDSRRRVYDDTGAYPCEPANGSTVSRRQCQVVRTITPGIYVAPGP